MRKICLYIFAFIWSGVLCAADNASLAIKNSAVASVCFFDFNAESLFGRDENSISDPIYCHYKIDKIKFLNLLSPKPDSEFYMPNYIRAKITISPSEVYFIDNNGVVRYGTKRFSIDKVKFTDSLENVKKSAHP
jgi:hypothetical protein